MARRFGRLWSVALAIALLFITLAFYYTSQAQRDASVIVVEPESKVVLEDSRPAETASPVGVQETLPEDRLFEAIEKGSGNVEEQISKPESEPPEEPQSQPAQPEAPTTSASSTETASQESPSPESDSPELPSPTPIQPGNGEPELPNPMAEASGDKQQSEASNEEQSEEQPPGDQEGEVEEEEEQEPEPPPPTKAVVMGKLFTEETDWVDQELQDWQNAIYVVDLQPGEVSPTRLRTKMNKAREAMPYLTYIIDNYPDFPDVVAFIHPHRRGMPMAWHNDARGNDAVNMLRDLRIDTVLDRGYVNLRCNNEVGCPDEVQPFREPPDPEKHAEHAFPYVYGHFFNVTFGFMRENIATVATQCCAQFAVSKDQLLKLPKSEYERYRLFLEETHYDDATVGRVMEYMWHIIFGRDAVHCENMFDCWCAVYGRCFGNMRGSGAGSGHPPW